MNLCWTVIRWNAKGTCKIIYRTRYTRVPRWLGQLLIWWQDNRA